MAYKTGSIMLKHFSDMLNTDAGDAGGGGKQAYIRL